MEQKFHACKHLQFVKSVENLENNSKLTLNLNKILDFLKDFVKPNLDSEEQDTIKDLIDIFTKEYPSILKKLPELTLELNFNFDEYILNGDLIIEIMSSARGEKTINNVSLKTPIKNLTIELDKELKEAIELSIKDFKATLFIDNLELEDGSEKYKIRKIELEY